LKSAHSAAAAPKQLFSRHEGALGSCLQKEGKKPVWVFFRRFLFLAKKSLKVLIALQTRFVFFYFLSSQFWRIWHAKTASLVRTEKTAAGNNHSLSSFQRPTCSSHRTTAPRPAPSWRPRRPTATTWTATTFSRHLPMTKTRTIDREQVQH
jgi:hypothetical protein